MDIIQMKLYSNIKILYFNITWHSLPVISYLI